MVFDCFEQHRDRRGWLVAVGGFLVHLSLGTIYTIGNMSPYFISYIQAYSGPRGLGYDAGTWAFAAALIGQGACMFLGGALMSRIGARWTTLIGSLIMSVGMFLSYFTIRWNYYALLMTYGVMFGIGIGFAYAPPMACAMKWLPQHKGLVNGVVVAGFGGGAFIFNLVQTAYINPLNKSPDEPAFPGSTEMYFSKEKAGDVLARVPSCFLVLGGCYLTLQILGCMLITDPPPGREEPDRNGYLHDDERARLVDNEGDLERERELSTAQSTADNTAGDHPKVVLRTRAFWTLWGIFLLNGQAVTFISSLYKPYGQSFISDDRFLAIVGALSSILNATGRIGWGRLVDKVCFKVCMLCLCTSLITWLVLLVASPYIGSWMYLVCVSAIFATFSGNFALLPTATARAFGARYVAVNYGLLFTSQLVTGLLGATIATTLLTKLQYSGMFLLAAAFSFIAWCLAFSFNVKDEKGLDI